MHQIQLNDQLYQEAQARAADAGFTNVDDYVAQVLHEEFQDDVDLPPGFFTPERLAQIAEAEAEIDRGEFYTLEQVDAELDKLRAEWARQNQSAK